MGQSQVCRIASSQFEFNINFDYAGELISILLGIDLQVCSMLSI